MVGLTKYAGMRLYLSRFSEETYIDNVRPSLAIVTYSWTTLDQNFHLSDILAIGADH